MLGINYEFARCGARKRARDLSSARGRDVNLGETTCPECEHTLRVGFNGATRSRGPFWDLAYLVVVDNAPCPEGCKSIGFHIITSDFDPSAGA